MKMPPTEKSHDRDGYLIRNSRIIGKCSGNISLKTSLSCLLTHLSQSMSLFAPMQLFKADMDIVFFIFPDIDPV